MSSQTAVQVRFPSGFSETTYAAETPEVGDVLRRGNDMWEVVAVEDVEHGTVVILDNFDSVSESLATGS